MEGKKQKAAEDYLQFSSVLQNMDGMRLLERMDPVPGEVVLDLGCGTGYLSSVIAEKVGTEGRVVAVDPDGYRVRVAKATFGHLENLTFAEGSSDDFPDMGKGCYDAVYLNYVLHWINDKRDAFKKIYRSLKPGGRVAMLYSLEISPLFLKTVRELNPEEIYQRLIAMWFCESQEMIEEYCREAGFVITESVTSKEYAFHKDLNNYLRLASATSHGEFYLDLIEEETLKMFQPVLDKDGRICNEYVIGILIATKM